MINFVNILPSIIYTIGWIYFFKNFVQKKEINPDTAAPPISGKGLCHSSGLVMKKAKNSPTNISVKS